jgi:hypothetical protein
MNQRGSAIIESMFCIMLLCLILFGLLQIFHWTMAKMLAEYSSFYAAKGESLGYAHNIVVRAGRLAMAGVAGHDESIVPAPPPNLRSELSLRAEDYMLYSQFGVYGVNYEYWEPAAAITSETPLIQVNYWNNGSLAGAQVGVQNMPLLHPNISGFVGGATSVDIPVGVTSTYNHAKHYLQE